MLYFNSPLVIRGIGAKADIILQKCIAVTTFVPVGRVRIKGQIDDC